MTEPIGTQVPVSTSGSGSSTSDIVDATAGNSVPAVTDTVDVQPDPQQTIDFLKALYPELPQGKGVVSWAFTTVSERLENRHGNMGTWPEQNVTHDHEWLAGNLIRSCQTIGAKTFKKFGKVIDEISDYGMNVPVTGVFLRMPSLGEWPDGNKRGEEGQTKTIYGIPLDGDYGVRGHKRKETSLPNPDTAEEVKAIWTAALGAEATIEWNSGGGLNGFWALKEPIDVPDGEEGALLLKRWKELAERFNARVVREAADRDLNHDSVPDLNRLMRVPGTINAKKGCKPVLSTLISVDGPRYTIEELEAIAPAPYEREDGALVDPITEMVVREPRPKFENDGPVRSWPEGSESPSDHFNREMWANGCAGFIDMIEAEGFGLLGYSGGAAFFERPGKEGSGENGGSLGTNDALGAMNAGAKFWSYSTNNPGLLGIDKKPGGDGGCYRQYISPFIFLAATQYDKEIIDDGTGQFHQRTLREAMSACGKALHAQGYGTRATRRVNEGPTEEELLMREEEAQLENVIEEEPKAGAPKREEQHAGNVPELHVGMWGHDFYTKSGWSDIYGVLKDLRSHCLSHIGVPTLRRWREDWFKWNGRHFVQVSREDQQRWFWWRMDGAYTWYFVPDEKNEDGSPLTKEQKRQAIKDGNGHWESMPWNPKPNLVRELETAGKQVFKLNDTVEPNTWLTTSAETPDDRFLACKNGLLNLRTRQLKKNDPLFFNTYSVPYAYDADAKCPLWQEKLCEVFEHDPAGLLTFQEMFGYILSGRTDMQKMFLVVGPKRGFKGTTGRILGAMVGEENVCGATLGQLNASNNFGMWDLTEKPLAIFGDVRIQGRMDTGVVEKLLSISGEDKMRVDRKNRQPLNVRIPARLVMFSNHIPVFGDASGALQGRFINFRWVKSWYGEEDHGLTGKLEKELPGILNWALEGLDRLERNGKFTPNGEQEVLGQMMRETSDPMGLFLEEECDIDESIGEEGRYWITKEEFRSRWTASRVETGAGDDGTYKDTDANVGRLLAASFPHLGEKRVRIPGVFGPDGKPKQTRVYLGIRLKSPVTTGTQGTIENGLPVVAGQTTL